MVILTNDTDTRVLCAKREARNICSLLSFIFYILQHLTMLKQTMTSIISTIPMICTFDKFEPNLK